METIILKITFLFGVLTSLVSLSLLVYFSRSRKPLGWAVAFMLFGEFFAMLMTAAFAYMELAGLFPKLSILGASMMRLAMFIVTMASSLHLTFVVRDVLKELEK